jgi:hypothetical protein
MDEKIKTQRKQWQKPELIVLVRSKPEEAVLSTCKVKHNPLGPNKTANDCSGGKKCTLCSASIGT